MTYGLCRSGATTWGHETARLKRYPVDHPDQKHDSQCYHGQFFLLETERQHDATRLPSQHPRDREPSVGASRRHAVTVRRVLELMVSLSVHEVLDEGLALAVSSYASAWAL
jgi:hypothetical protein